MTSRTCWRCPKSPWDTFECQQYQSLELEKGNVNNLKPTPIAYKYKKENDLLATKKQIRQLLKSLHDMHVWYKCCITMGHHMLGVRIPPEIYHTKREGTMFVDLECLFQLF